MDGIVLRVKENGQIEEYKEPYTTIECATEEDYKRLERLLEIGKATEKAFKDGYIFCFKRPDGTILECMKNEQELLKED